MNYSGTSEYNRRGELLSNDLAIMNNRERIIVFPTGIGIILIIASYLLRLPTLEFVGGLFLFPLGLLILAAIVIGPIGIIHEIILWYRNRRIQ